MSIPVHGCVRTALVLTCVLTAAGWSARECHAQLPTDQASLETAADLRVQAFAHEPQLVCPSAFDVDEYGRVWVAEGVNYRPEYRGEG